MMQKLSRLITIFQKHSQQITTSPKFTLAITTNVSSINKAIADLSSAQTLIKDTVAINAILKIVSYLSWYRTIGIGGDTSSAGKQNLIPSIQEIKNIIQTKLFGINFILSLTNIMQLNDYAPEIRNEFSKIETTATNQ